jgi:demethylmenaquinone methyltransferase/2-methoxy-6-polyprenyl-1,4-benzoquinol methylase/phosphoethanolamine N-methyltransferase
VNTHRVKYGARVSLPGGGANRPAAVNPKLYTADMHGHSAAPGTATTTGRVLHSARFYDLAATLLTLGREKRVRRETVALAGVVPGDAVLDVGCGTGTLTLAAKAAVGAGGRVCGIDPSPAMIEASRAKAKKARVDVDFRSGVIENLAFEDASFDAVLSSLMLHHLPDDVKRKGFAEIARVLKPGGRFVAVDLAGGSPGLSMHLPFLRHMRGAPHAPAARHGDGFASAAEMLADAGFKDVTTGTMKFRLLHYLRAVRV